MFATKTSKMQEQRAICCNPPCEESADLICTRCKMRFYCSQKCQVEHWNASHKAECKTEAKRRLNSEKSPQALAQAPPPQPPVSVSNSVHAISTSTTTTTTTTTTTSTTAAAAATTTTTANTTTTSTTAAATTSNFPLPAVNNSPPPVVERPRPDQKVEKVELDPSTCSQIFSLCEFLFENNLDGANYVMTLVKRIIDNPDNASYRSIDITSAFFRGKAGILDDIILNLMTLIGFVSPDSDRNKRVLQANIETLNAVFESIQNAYNIFEKEFTPVLIPAEVPLSPPQKSSTSDRAASEFFSASSSTAHLTSSSTAHPTSAAAAAAAAAGAAPAPAPASNKEKEKVDPKLLDLLQAIRDEGDDSKKCNLLNEVGLFYSRTCDHAKAREYFYKCLTLCREIKHNLLNGCLSNLGSVCFSLGDYKASREYRQECYDDQKDTTDPTLFIVLLSNLANSFAAEGNFEHAKELLLQAYNKSKSMPPGRGDNVHLSLCHNIASFCASDKLKNYSEASRFLEEALRIREEATNQGEEERTHIDETKQYLKYVNGQRESDGSAANANRQTFAATSATTAASTAASTTLAVDTASSPSGKKPSGESSPSTTAPHLSHPMSPSSASTSSSNASTHTPTSSNSQPVSGSTPATPAPVLSTNDDIYGDQLYCSAPGCTRVATKKCQCSLVNYCGLDCQKKHWSDHKGEHKTKMGLAINK